MNFYKPLSFAQSALGMMILGFLVVGTLLLIGDRTVPKVKHIQIQTGKEAYLQSQVVLTFNREMDKKNIEEQFTITPPTSGKFSWIGQRMAFTPDAPFEQGTTYEIRISKLLDKRGKQAPKEFTHTFDVPLSAFVFIGTEGKSYRRIAKYFPGEQRTTLLTPEGLEVLSFKVRPGGKQIIFGAVEREEQDRTKNLLDQQKLYLLDLGKNTLYTIADTENFVNFTYEISGDGGLLALYRVELGPENTLKSSGIWTKSLIEGEKGWTPLWYQDFVNGPFMLTADGSGILGTEYKNNTFVYVPTKKNEQGIKYLGNYPYSYGFTPDGKEVLFGEIEEKENTHIVALAQSGAKKTFLENTGVIDQVQIFPTSDQFALTLLRKEDIETERERFHLYLYDRTTQILEGVAENDAFSDGTLDVASDGKRILFERYDPEIFGTTWSPERLLQESMEYTIMQPEIWMYDVAEKKANFTQLKGRFPQWLE